MQRSNLDSSSLSTSLSFSLKRARASSREEQTTLFPFFVSRALRVRSSLAVIDRSRSEETERKRKKSLRLCFLWGLSFTFEWACGKKKNWHITRKDLCVSPGAPPAPVTTVVGRLFSIFLFFSFSLHSLLDGGTWLQTVELGSVLECDWKMRFIVPKNHPERKRTSILV